jgi:phosphoserine phosphatase
MNTITDSISLLKFEVKEEQKWAIFDVDRVLINTTSWFHACITPDLLIPKNRISKFMEINGRTYSKIPSYTQDQFREETLKILNKKITSNFINLFKKEKLIFNYFTIDNYVNTQTLYAAGYYIGANLYIYKEAKAYLSYLSKLYGDTLRILYLSAGYQPFIEGLIKRFYDDKRIITTKYSIIGSGINFYKGQGRESFHCYGNFKKEIVETIIANKGKIIFAADDDKNNIPMLDFVSKNGGKPLFIRHKSNEFTNPNWNYFIKNNLSRNKIVQELIDEQNIYAPYKKLNIENDYTALFNKFHKYINKIGIVKLSKPSYQKALDNLLNRVILKKDKEKIVRIFSLFIFEKDNYVFLRGKYFYFWIPTHIFLDTETMFEK